MTHYTVFNQNNENIILYTTLSDNFVHGDENGTVDKFVFKGDTYYKIGEEVLQDVLNGNILISATNGVLSYTNISSSRAVQRVRGDKISQCISFWNGGARVMTIKNGHTQLVKVDQDFANNINSAIQQAKESGEKTLRLAIVEAQSNNTTLTQEQKDAIEKAGQIYIHRLRDNNGNVILENGEPVLIPMTLDALNTISQKIEYRRGYCATCRDTHIALIKSLADNADTITQYNYITSTNPVGSAYIQPEQIQLDSSGNIVTI